MAKIIVNSVSVLDDILVTPDIVGGIGAVFIGTPARTIDGKYIIDHSWNEIDLTWIQKYCENEDIEIIV